MTRTRLIALGSVFLLIVVAVIIVTNQRRDHHFQVLAQAYRQQELRDLSNSPSATDARSWLERNGFKVALYNGNVAAEEIEQTPQGEKRTNFVAGYRLVAPSSGMHAERWVEMVFLFRGTQEPSVPGDFLGAEVYDDCTPSKAWKTEFDRRSYAPPARPGGSGG
jgi:hypothetical protein